MKASIISVDVTFSFCISDCCNEEFIFIHCQRCFCYTTCTDINTPVNIFCVQIMLKDCIYEFMYLYAHRDLFFKNPITFPSSTCIHLLRGLFHLSFNIYIYIYMCMCVCVQQQHVSCHDRNILFLIDQMMLKIQLPDEFSDKRQITHYSSYFRMM